MFRGASRGQGSILSFATQPSKDTDRVSAVIRISTILAGSVALKADIDVFELQQIH